MLSSLATSQDPWVSNANALEIEVDVDAEAEAEEAAIPYIAYSEKNASTKKMA